MGHLWAVIVSFNSDNIILLSVTKIGDKSVLYYTDDGKKTSYNYCEGELYFCYVRVKHV